ELLALELVREEPPRAVDDTLARRRDEDVRHGDAERVVIWMAAALQKQCPVDYAVHRVDVDDHVREHLQVLLLLLERRQLLLDEDLRRVGDDALRDLGRAMLAVERAADPGRPALPVGDLALYLSNEVQEREAARADALEQRRWDDQAIDLVRALEDAVDARVAIVALDRILGREAIAAERLQRLVRDEVHRLGAEHLQDRRLDRVLLDRLLDDPSRRVR